MEITKESFGKKLGDLIDLFNKLETEEDFKQFYKTYYQIIEETVCKEKNLDWGDRRPIGETYERLWSNLLYLLSEGNKMRADYAHKIWWFL